MSPGYKDHASFRSKRESEWILEVREQFFVDRHILKRTLLHPFSRPNWLRDERTAFKCYHIRNRFDEPVR